MDATAGSSFLPAVAMVAPDRPGLAAMRRCALVALALLSSCAEDYLDDEAFVYGTAAERQAARDAGDAAGDVTPADVPVPDSVDNATDVYMDGVVSDAPVDAPQGGPGDVAAGDGGGGPGDGAAADVADVATGPGDAGGGDAPDGGGDAGADVPCPPGSDGQVCDDDNACTVADVCKGGVCLPGAATTCDDGNACTGDYCAKDKGCTHVVVGDGKSCDADGNPCTPGDTCKAGTCHNGVAKNCDDEVSCTADGCDTQTGACVHDPSTKDGETCDDGDACTDSDACAGGKCQGTVLDPAVKCDDEKACTDQACDKETGCHNPPNTAKCDDGDACTKNDTCAAGQCAGLAFDVTTTCDDNNPCSTDTCDKGKGCVHTPVADGQPCGKWQVCKAGKCKDDWQCGDGIIEGPEACDDGNLTKGDGCTDKCVKEKDFLGMNRVPGGTFWMGCDDDDPKTPWCGGFTPVRKVTLSPFWLDIDEVTVDEYAQCVAVKDCTAPASNKSDPALNWGKPGRGNHPVNGVSWKQAQTFCEKWRGGRLPTEAEWEMAARGSCELLKGKGPCDRYTMRTRPWGEAAATCAQAIHKGGGKAGCGTGITAPVGSLKHKGDGPWGHHDLLGNVGELVLDVYASDVYPPGLSAKDPVYVGQGVGHVLRGGSFETSAKELYSARRWKRQPQDNKLPSNGFRCVRDAPVCGDGERQGSEACDDGNTVGGDGCAADCTPEKGWQDRVFVPAGPFFMGCNAALDKDCAADNPGSYDDAPQHEVDVSAFWIGRTEVTVAEHRACILAGACTEVTIEGTACANKLVAQAVNWGANEKLRGDHPAHCVTALEADAHCAWRGGRLPTEAEWEKAARGGCEMVFGQDCASAMRTYPWGETPPSCKLVVMGGAGDPPVSWGCNSGGTQPVGGKIEGASAYGVLGMAGNVGEYTADEFKPAYVAYAKSADADPYWPDSGNMYHPRVLKGVGIAAKNATAFRVAFRGKINAAVSKAVFFGFRCAWDAIVCGDGRQGGAEQCDDGNLKDGDGCSATCTLEKAWKDKRFVPAGSFWMGCNAALDELCQADEKPQHLVSTGPFWIDATEVSVARYEACVNAGKCTKPNTTNALCSGAGAKTGKRNNWLQGRATHPVNCVSYQQASAFCAWAGGKLPSEAWWEKAARGGCRQWGATCRTRTPTHPWGEAKPQCDLASLDIGGDGCGASITSPVGSRAAGASPYGVLNMGGNVHEWVSDGYAKDAYTKHASVNPEYTTSYAKRVVRGSAIAIATAPARAADRYEVAADAVSPAIGLRCVYPIATCDDGDACTPKDFVHPQTGKCFHSQANCDDANACTLDGCDPLKGCTHSYTTGACDDGDACTAKSQCQVGACVSTAPKTCDDGNPCTKDACDAKTGCTSAPVKAGAPCDDGGACSMAGTCAQGKCAVLPELWAQSWRTKPGQIISHADLTPWPGGGYLAVVNLRSADGKAIAGLLIRLDAAGRPLDGAGKVIAAGKAPADVATLAWGKQDDKATPYALLSAFARETGGKIEVVAAGHDNKFRALLLRFDGAGALKKAAIIAQGTSTPTQVLPLAGGVLVVGTTNAGGTTNKVKQGNGDEGWVVALGADNKPLPNANKGTRELVWGDTTHNGLRRAFPRAKGGWIACGATGFHDSSDHHLAQGLVLAVHPDGDKALWPQPVVVGATGRADELTDLVADGKGGWLAVGSWGASPTGGGKRGWVVRVVEASGQGQVDWQRRYGGQLGSLWRIVPTADGFVSLGVRDAKVNGKDHAMDLWLVGISAAGDSFMERTWGTALYNDASSALLAEADGQRLVVAGTLAMHPTAVRLARVQRLDGWGNETCAASGACVAMKAAECADGDLCTLDHCVAAKCSHPITTTTCDDDVDCTLDACVKTKGCVNTVVADGAPCADGSDDCRVLQTCKGGKCQGGKPALWQRSYHAGPNTYSRTVGVAVHDGGRVSALIHADEPPPGTFVPQGQTLLKRYEADGSELPVTLPGLATGEVASAPKALAARPDGGVVIVGASYTKAHDAAARARVMAVDGAGKPAWSYQSPLTGGWFNAVAMAPVSGGKPEVVAAGTYATSTMRKGLLVRLSAEGQHLATRDLGQKVGVHVAAVLVRPGEILVAGRRGGGLGENLVVALDRKLAKVLWSRAWGRPMGGDGMFGLAPMGTTGALAVGGGFSKKGGSYPITYAFSAGDKQLWRRWHAGKPRFFSAIVEVKGHYIAAGTIYGNGGLQGHLTWLDSGGRELRQRQAGKTVIKGQEVFRRWSALAVHGRTLVAGGWGDPVAGKGAPAVVGRLDLFGNETCANSMACADKELLACDNASPCLPDGCLKGACVTDTKANDGQACPGDTACLLGTCVAGKCAVPQALKCDDDNPCTVDSCQDAGGCQYDPAKLQTPCQDSSVCAAAGKCNAAGICTVTGGPVCDDGVACTKDGCDYGTLKCKHVEANPGCAGE